jgi:hypothetical protein
MRQSGINKAWRAARVASVTVSIILAELKIPLGEWCHMFKKTTAFLVALLVSVVFLAACDESTDLTLTWNGLDEFEGAELHAILELNPPASFLNNPDAGSAMIDENGSATIVLEVDGEKDYDLYYYVDHNGDGACDESDSTEIKGDDFIPSGVEEKVMGYLSGFVIPEGVCPHFDIPEPTIEPDDGGGSSDVPLTLRWTGLEEFGDVMINARLIAEDGHKIGPYQTHYERGRGRAEVPQEFVNDFKWTILVWMDVDGTFSCNDDSTDIVREYEIPLGAREFTMAYDSSLDTRGDSICARMFGDANYDPPIKSE